MIFIKGSSRLLLMVCVSNVSLRLCWCCLIEKIVLGGVSDEIWRNGLVTCYIDILLGMGENMSDNTKL